MSLAERKESSTHVAEVTEQAKQNAWIKKSRVAPYSEAVGSRIHEAKALLSPLVQNKFNVYSRGLKKNKKPSSKTLKMSTWVPIPSRRKRLADPPYLMEGIDPT